MRRCLLLLLAISVYLPLVSCKQRTGKKADKDKAEATQVETTEAKSENAAITFNKVVHDFGMIKEGETVETDFEFTNTGKADLHITGARGSCGCTIPEYPKDKSIAPGESGKITVRFDSSNKTGKQQKTVSISTNTDKKQEILKIEAMVTPDPVKQKQRDKQREKLRQQQND